MRNEKESCANKVISLQAQLDQMEEFKDTVNQMLQDTYYRVWETSGLAWMSDYPQVMAGIDKRLQDNLITRGQLSDDAPTDSLLVDSYFTVKELEAIQQGYKLLAEEEAEEETEDPSIAGRGDRAATGSQGVEKDNLFFMTHISIHVSHLFFVDNPFLYCADASASERVPTHSPTRDPEPDKSPKWPHRPGKKPRDPFQP